MNFRLQIANCIATGVLSNDAARSVQSGASVGAIVDRNPMRGDARGRYTGMGPDTRDSAARRSPLLGGEEVDARAFAGRTVAARLPRRGVVGTASPGAARDPGSGIANARLRAPGL